MTDQNLYDMEVLISKISEKLKKDPTCFQAVQDMYQMCYMYPGATNFRQGLCRAEASCHRGVAIAVRANDGPMANKWMRLHEDILEIGAPTIFDMFLQYVQWDRDPEKKFYYPRRRQLKQIVDAMQDLADDKLDILGISVPPGCGKSGLAIFYLTWLAGQHPDKQILTGSHSNSWVRGAYDECLRIMDPKGQYRWRRVFPLVHVTNTNAKDCRIDLDKPKRFETLEFTSIGTGNAGLYRATQLLYCDDLVSGIEVALSKDRLDKLWDIYVTDLRQRKQGRAGACKELHIATRWSVHDVIGRLQREYEDNPKAKFIVIPALNDKDESNFDYAYGVGFNTAFYREQRQIMDDVSWRALYMNEPIEREGLLYHEDELRRYFELPSQEPDSILAVCDTKDRGADYCVMPIAYQYGQDFYIQDFVCDNSNPDVVDGRLVEKLLCHKVQMARFESNSAGGRVAQTVQEKIKQKGGITKITTKFSTANKDTRIIVSAEYAKAHFLFKDKSVYEHDKEYRSAMQWLCGYTMAGKNKHDDVPDAISMLVDFVENMGVARVQVVQRIF